ncbi:hypothetical protein [Clostridium estertheticum]|nr:hypothetical protein [Clostridium estertheticum]MCB2338878.1 hypothetical protein [Clostridium estertheticum]
MLKNDNFYLGYKLGEKSLTLEFKAGEMPVMSQWATGSYVDEWQKKVK